CRTGEQCAGGNCVCDGLLGLESSVDGQTCCPGVGCAPLDVDPLSCGACGVTCQPGETCVSGECRCGNGTQCGPAESCCGLPGSEQCVPTGDPACDCAGEPCGSAEKCCAANDTCQSLRSDHGNCGACGTMCTDDEVCLAG